MRRITTIIAATGILLLTAAGAAMASSNPLIHGNQIANGAISHSKLNGNSIWNNDLGGRSVSCGKLTLDIQSDLGACGGQNGTGPTGPKGSAGVAGPVGPVGPAGPQGPKGDDFLAGAYYSVAHYDVGNTNGGAIATVACKEQTDTAISGGVSVDDPTKNVPVGQSFPGREDFSGDAGNDLPKPGRLDGWIIQFASQNESAPLAVKVYALCVPGLSIPVETTFTQSDDS